MTDREFDAQLRAALLEAQHVRWDAVTAGGPELSWSPRRRREIRRMLKDPLTYAQNYGVRPRHPALRTVGRLAACFVIACICTLMISEPARVYAKQAVQMVLELLDINARFTFQGEADGELGTWRPTYVPEGYEEVEAFETGYGWEITYENAEEDYFTFSYKLVSDGIVESIDNEHSDYEMIVMNDQPAYFFRSNTEGYPSYLNWFNETGQITYSLMIDISPEEVLKVAESVKMIEQ